MGRDLAVEPELACALVTARASGAESGSPQAGFGQQLDNHLVGDRPEVGVEVPDRAHPAGDDHRHELVGGVFEHGGSFSGSDGGGHHYPGGAEATGYRAGRQGGGARGDAVVDDHRRLAPQVGRRAALPEQLGLPGHLLSLPPFHPGHLVGTDPQLRDPVLVDYPDPFLAQRSDGKFRLERGAQLAHQQHLQRRRQSPRHFETNGKPAARQAEDHGGITSQMVQAACQSPSGVGAVYKPHGAFLWNTPNCGVSASAKSPGGGSD